MNPTGRHRSSSHGGGRAGDAFLTENLTFSTRGCKPIDVGVGQLTDEDNSSSSLVPLYTGM